MAEQEPRFRLNYAVFRFIKRERTSFYVRKWKDRRVASRPATDHT